MSNDNTSPRDFIFIDGLRSRPRGTIRAHISREVCRQKRIKKALAYQNSPSSALLGWQQRPNAPHDQPLAEQGAVQHSDSSSINAKCADPDSNSTPTSQASKGKELLVRQEVIPQLLRPQQLPQKHTEDHVLFEEATGSWHGGDYGEFADPVDQQWTEHERGRQGKPGHRATSRPRNKISPASITPMNSGDSPCRIGAGFSDPFQIFPIKMDAPTQRALYRLLDDSPSNRFRAYRDAWFGHAMSDSAAFKQFLSTFALHLQRVQPSTAAEMGALTMSLHMQALRSVNERIVGPNFSMDEGLLVAIMSFIAHYQLLEKYDAWQTHIRGLEDIIRVRGGLEKAFSKNKALRTMLFFIDLQGSWLQDRPPHFPLPHDSLPNVQSPSLSSSSRTTFPLAMHMSRTWRDRFPQRHAIPDILDDLAIVITHLISESSRTAGAIWTDSITTGLWLNPIVHRLLQLRIEQADCLNGDDVLQESVRIATMLFLTRTKFHASLISAFIMNHVIKLKACLSSADEAHWARLEPLKIWILVMGGINAEESSTEKVWFGSEILDMARHMKMAHWREAEATAKSLLWIEDLVHDQAQTFWRDLGALEKVVKL